MIDTVSIAFDGIPVRDGMISDWGIPEKVQNNRWYYKPKGARIYNETPTQKAVISLQEAGRTLRLYCSDQLVDGLQVSLPNLHFRRGGECIESQEELNAALATVWTRVNEVCDIHDIPTVEFRRIDLSLQFDVPGVPPVAFFRSLRHARHPLIHADSTDWKVPMCPSGLSFKGTHSNIIFYDKRCEMRLGAGNIVRVELQLKGLPLKRLLGLGGNLYPSTLNFSDCYRVFREQLLEFRENVHHSRLPDSVLTVRQAVPHLIAELEEAGVRLPGNLSVYELLDALPIQRQALAKLRNEVVSAQLEKTGISLEDMLPRQWPPPHFVKDANPPNLVGG